MKYKLVAGRREKLRDGEKEDQIISPVKAGLVVATIMSRRRRDDRKIVIAGRQAVLVDDRNTGCINSRHGL